MLISLAHPGGTRVLLFWLAQLLLGSKQQISLIIIRDIIFKSPHAKSRFVFNHSASLIFQAECIINFPVDQNASFICKPECIKNVILFSTRVYHIFVNQNASFIGQPECITFGQNALHSSGTTINCTSI